MSHDVPLMAADQNRRHTSFSTCALSSSTTRASESYMALISRAPFQTAVRFCLDHTRSHSWNHVRVVLDGRDHDCLDGTR